MTQEYWDIKEQFGFLRTIAKYMDAIREIRTLYPNTENMTIKDTEEWLTNRYTEMDANLEKELKLDKKEKKKANNDIEEKMWEVLINSPEYIKQIKKSNKRLAEAAFKLVKDE